MPTVRRAASRSQSERPVSRRRQAQQEALKRQQHQKTKPEPENNHAPLLLKILSWLGIILLCFVLGYLGTSWFVDFMNRKLLLKPENRIENQEDLSNFESSEQERIAQEVFDSGAEVKQISLNLYHVKDDTIAETRQNFIVRIPEDNISDAINSILILSGIPGADRIKLLHVFRISDTAFLDMSGQFVSALESIGQRRSLLLLTGIVRTLQENFSPLSQVRFLIDSKPPKSGGVVDLSVSWKMPNRS